MVAKQGNHMLSGFFGKILYALTEFAFSDFRGYS
jgi:hypothetical protein